jgi:hypothetical protein
MIIEYNKCNLDFKVSDQKILSMLICITAI